MVATPASTVSSITAAKSSTTRIPIISLPRRWSNCPDSRSMVIRMAELLMDNAAARKTASVPVQPSRTAISYPRANMMVISTVAIRITLVPTARIRCQPNSKPIPNRRSINPRSASSRMVSRFFTSGIGRVKGPMITPARR